MNAYAYLPPDRKPFITKRKELPHKKATKDQIRMKRFFQTHDIVEYINPVTGEIEIKAVLKNESELLGHK